MLGAVEREAGVILASDLHLLLDQDLLDGQALKVHAEDLTRNLASLFGRVRELDPAGLTAASYQDLRLHRDRTEAPGDRLGLLRSLGDLAGWNGNAGLPQQVLRNVLLKFQERSLLLRCDSLCHRYNQAYSARGRAMQGIDRAALDPILNRVKKPARYTGGEWNSVVKDPDSVRLQILLSYPDAYEVGVSNQGVQILYSILNRDERYLAERVYAPWPDMEAALRSVGLPLFSLETKRPLRAFDVIGFSLGYETVYTNVLTMLDLGGVPLRSADRADGDPLIVAGGHSAYNPEPMAPFFDAMCIGEGEEALPDLLEAVEPFRLPGGG